MSKERELLERVLASSHLVTGLEKEIQELLAQPEQKPLSDEEKRLEAIAIKQREVHGIGGDKKEK